MTKKSKTQEISEQSENERILEEQHKLDLEHDYEEYVLRIKVRNEAMNGSEKKIEVKPFEKWIRKVKKADEYGNEIEISVPGDTGESKNEKFRRLAVKRMEKALKDLDTIMNLFSSQYESSPGERAKIIYALRTKILDIENSFKEKQTEIEKFTL